MYTYVYKIFNHLGQSCKYIFPAGWKWYFFSGQILAHVMFQMIEDPNAAQM